MKVKMFKTPTCTKCPEQISILEEIENEDSSVEFEKIDATENTEEANKYGVRSVPFTVVLEDDESVVSTFSGVVGKSDIVDAINNGK